MNDFEEDKIWEENGSAKRQDVVGGILPTIQEEAKKESAISGNYGNYGDRVNLPGRRETDTDEKALGVSIWEG